MTSNTRGQKIVSNALKICITIYFLQIISMLGFEFNYLNFFNWINPLLFLYFSVPLLFVIPILYYLVLRGNKWACWVFAIIALMIGFSFLISSITNFLVEKDSIFFLEGYFFEIFIHFVLSLAQLTVSFTLIFSESVGDFFDFKNRRIIENKWNEYTKTKKNIKAHRAHRVFDRNKLYFNLKQRQKIGRLIPKTTVFFIILGWIMFCIYLYYKADEVHNEFVAELLQSKAFSQNNPWGAIGLMIGNSVKKIYEITKVIIIGYLFLFVFPAVITLPVLIPLAFLWRKPANFLLLRPFNRSWVSKKLRDIIQSELGSLGHCYTLADLKIRVPLYIRVPFLFGQVSMFNFRIRKIRRPKHINRLIHSMNRIVIRNLNWYLSLYKIFPVACSNSGWRACVEHLAEKMDFIVIDISGISTNIIWEIELLKNIGAINRSIFLVHQSEKLKSEEVFVNLFKQENHNPILLTYSTSDSSKLGIIQSAAVNIICS